MSVPPAVAVQDLADTAAALGRLETGLREHARQTLRLADELAGRLDVVRGALANLRETIPDGAASRAAHAARRIPIG